MKTTNENPHGGHRERLRNKFVIGKQAFQEHELLELLLSYAIPRKDTNALAHKLINTFGSLNAVLDKDVEILSTVDGVGQNTATLLSLVGYINSLGDKKNKKEHTDRKSPYSEKVHKGEYHHTHKLEGIAKLVILLGKIGYSNEGHIEYYVLA